MTIWLTLIWIAVSLPRCRHRRAAAKLPSTSRCHAAATTAATVLLPPRCHRRAVRRRRSAAAKLPPTSRCRAAATASPPPSCRRRPLLRCRHRLAAAKLPPTSRFCAAATASPPPSCRRRPLLRCRHRRSCRAAAAALPPPPRRHSLVGCCVVVRRPISSSHAVMRPSTLSLPAAFANKCRHQAATNIAQSRCRHRR